MKDLIHKLLFQPTTSLMIQLFRYCIVGGIAFVADNGSYYLATLAGCHYFLAAFIGFIIGLGVNYLLSKLFVFKKESARTNAVSEFIIYGLIGAAGLLICELLIWIFIEKLLMDKLLSKLIASGVVLIWNFAARKAILYKKTGSGR